MSGPKNVVAPPGRDRGAEYVREMMNGDYEIVSFHAAGVSDMAARDLVSRAVSGRSSISSRQPLPNTCLAATGLQSRTGSAWPPEHLRPEIAVMEMDTDINSREFAGVVAGAVRSALEIRPAAYA